MGADTYRVERTAPGSAQGVRPILDSLPEWFDWPVTVDAYVVATAHLPTWLAYARNGDAVGFLCLQHHTPVAAEVYVMAVARTEHGKGCGRRLLVQAEAYLRALGIRWLTVKTLAASHPNLHYVGTRRFYGANGFEPLEVFPTLWSGDNPCVMMVKPLHEAEYRTTTP